MDTKKLRQKILDLAIRGKLVPQDPNDEPASVLLDRIRAEKERLIAEGKIKRPKKSKSTSADTSQYQNFEPPFEIPDSWKWVRLGEVARIGTGATPLKSNKSYYSGNINWVSSAVTSDEFVDYPTDRITQLAIDETNCEVYPIGTLLMAMYGEGKTRGQVTELRIESATNQACAAIRVYLSDINDFVKLYLISNYYHLRSLAEGGNQPNLNLGKIEQLQIPLPPLEEAKRITTEYTKLIDVVKQIEIKSAEFRLTLINIKSWILDLAMQGKLVPQDPADEPAAGMLRRINPKAEIITDNPHYAELPITWIITNFTDVCETKLGKTLNKETDNGEPKPYLCAINVKQGEFDLSVLKTTKFQATELDKYEVLRGDLMVCEGGDVGRCAIWEGDKIYFQNALHRVRAGESVMQKYLYYTLLYSKCKGWIDELCSGVTIKHFTTKSLSKLAISLPPLNEQKRIVAKIEELYSILDEIEKSLTD